MGKSNNNLSYLLITPARNEEAYIEKTIQSVVSQTVLPKRWVIVSDGSTDRTDEIVEKYLTDNPWIELVKRPKHVDRNWASKAHSFNAGYEKVRNLDYDVIGNLDADISFDEDYFKFLLGKFLENPDLGVSGTPFVEGSSHYDYRFTNIEHVSGACQLFRRKCFEEMGGYTPIKGGGIDWVAVTSARMKGWTTRTFTEKTCFHHRKLSAGNFNSFMASFKQGYKDYYLGGHPLWQVFRMFYQMKSKPYIVAGLLMFTGYAWGYLSRFEIQVSEDLMKFQRTEQMRRLKKIFLKPFNLSA